MVTRDELEKEFGKPGQYQKGYNDRLHGIKEPVEPDDIGYMRGWFSRLASETHPKGSDYYKVLPKLERLLKQWQKVCRDHDWPKSTYLPL